MLAELVLEVALLAQAPPVLVPGLAPAQPWAVGPVADLGHFLLLRAVRANLRTENCRWACRMRAWACRVDTPRTVASSRGRPRPSRLVQRRTTEPVEEKRGRLKTVFTGTVDVQYPTNTDGNTSGDVRNPTLHLRFGENCWNFRGQLRGSSRRSQPERKKPGSRRRRNPRSRHVSHAIPIPPQQHAPGHLPAFRSVALPLLTRPRPPHA